MSLHTSTLLLRSSCYASITGTSVLRVRGVPPRPPSYDGSLVVFDSPEGASIKERLKGFGTLKGGVEKTPWGHTAKFVEHAHAQRAVDELSSAKPPWGIALLYNDRAYDGVGGRGWCIFEGGVA